MIRTLGKSLAIFLGVSILVFLLFHLSGNDPVRNVLGENTNAEIIENTRRKWNLDLTLTEQYLLFLNGMSPISFHAQDEASRWHLRGFKPASGYIAALAVEGSHWNVTHFNRSSRSPAIGVTELG